MNLKKLIHHPLFWPIVGLSLLLLFNVLRELFFLGPDENAVFLNLEFKDGRFYGGLIDVLNLGAVGAILAIGMTLVIATKGVDLSIGSVMAISGAVAASTMTDMSFTYSILLALLVGIVCGACNGFLVSKMRIQPIVATLILMVAGRGVAKLVTKGFIIPVNQHDIYHYLGNGYFLGLPFSAVLAFIVLAISVWLTRKTAFGLFIESVGDNEKASHFAGINSQRIIFLAYVFCGLCAGIAGLVRTSYGGGADADNIGKLAELDAIFAVIVGGTALQGGRFFLMGSVIGAMLLQTLTTTMYTLGVPPDIAPVPKAIVIMGVCLLQSKRFRSYFKRNKVQTV